MEDKKWMASDVKRFLDFGSVLINFEFIYHLYLIVRLVSFNNYYCGVLYGLAHLEGNWVNASLVECLVVVV